MTISLQKATLIELDQTLCLVSAFHREGGFKTTNADRKQSLTTLLSKPELGGVWLIYHSDHLIGYIILCVGFSIEFGGFDAFVDEFFIQKAHRNKGYGIQTLEKIKLEAAKLNIRALHLEVAKSNSAARKLYAKANFIARKKYVLMSAMVDV